MARSYSENFLIKSSGNLHIDFQISIWDLKNNSIQNLLKITIRSRDKIFSISLRRQISYLRR